MLARYGSPEQQRKWLLPLLKGEIRSAFAMTEKNGVFHSTNRTLLKPSILVASSDARNIRTSMRLDGNDIVINGHKWYA